MTSTAQTPDAIQVANAKSPWLTKPRVRLLVSGVLFSVLGIVFILRDKPPVRLGLLKVFTVIYALYDPSLASNVATGPEAAITTQSTGLKRLIPVEETSGQVKYEIENGIVVIISKPSEAVGSGVESAKGLLQPIEFQFEDLASTQVASFRIASQEILAKATDEFVLCDLVRQLAEHGIDAEVADYSKPDEFLHAAQTGKPLLCHHFSKLYVGFATLKGYTARILGLSRNGETFDHAVAEVYSPKLGKWIVIDPDFNIAYRDASHTWLSAAEVHDAWKKWDPEITNVIAVPLGTAGEKLRQSNLTRGKTGYGLDLYENVLYRLRNDYLSASYPFAHPTRVKQYWLSEAPIDHVLRVCPEAVRIEDRRQVYWPVGRTQITLSYPGEAKPHESNPASLAMHLTTFTPNFSHFEIQIDQASAKQFSQAVYYPELKPGKNEIQVCAVNTAGLRGELVQLQVLVPSELRSAGKLP